MAGGVLLSMGIVGTAYAPNLETVFVTFGFLAGK